MAHNFAHVLGKGAYPSFKFKLKNIWLLCMTCHHDWDFGVKSALKFTELREEEQALKREYFNA